MPTAFTSECGGCAAAAPPSPFPIFGMKVDAATRVAVLVNGAVLRVDNGASANDEELLGEHGGRADTRFRSELQVRADLAETLVDVPEGDGIALERRDAGCRAFRIEAHVES